MRIWAGNQVYSAGHGNLTGRATKQDPGKTLLGSGFAPSRLIAQHTNHQLYEQSISFSAFVGISSRLQVLPDPTASYATAVTWNPGQNVAVLADTDNYLSVGDSLHAQTLASTSANTEDMAMTYDAPSGRLITVGGGTERARYSDDNGATWTAAAADPANDCSNVISLARTSDGAGHLAAARLATTAVVNISTNNGVNWVNRITNNNANRGLARVNGVNSPGVLVCGARRYETSEFSASTYATWTDRGDIPDESNADTDGWVAGDGQYRAYFAAKYGGEIRVYRAESVSDSWTQISQFSDTIGADDVQILIDRPSDSIYLILYDSPGARIYVSHNYCSSWQGPLTESRNYSTNRNLIRPAGGRLYFSRTVAVSGNAWYRTMVPSPR